MLEFPACAERLMFVYVVGVQTLPTSPDGDGGGGGGGRGGGGGGGKKCGVLVDEASGKYIRFRGGHRCGFSAVCGWGMHQKNSD